MARLILMLYNKVFIPFIWVMFFILSFRVLARFPSGIFEGLFLVMMVICMVLSIREIVVGWSKGKSNYYQLVLLPLFILPFIVALQANRIFGQPYLMGLLAQRQHFIIFAGYFLVLQFQKGRIDLALFERRMLLALGIIMSIMMFFSIFIDPRFFNGTDFVEFSLNKGWHYEFPSDVIATVILFSTFKVLSENRFRYLVPLLMGLLYFVIYIQDRSQLLVITTTIGIYFLRNVSLGKKVVYASWGILLLLTGFGIIRLANPELIDHYVTMFTNASTIATGGHTSEYSTNMRLAESAIALKGFAEHPFLGNGFVSAQYKGGFSGFFGYFYASDVGILGNLFVYGIIGTFIFYIPFLLVLSWTRKLRKYDDNLLTTAQYGLIFIFMDMITAASNIKYMGLPTIFFAIVYFYRFRNDNTTLATQKN